jgi:aerobic C4-dicarboxylate transport protein
MSECRALTNFIGNAVATIVVSRWERAIDEDKFAAVFCDQQFGPQAEIQVQESDAD